MTTAAFAIAVGASSSRASSPLSRSPSTSAEESTGSSTGASLGPFPQPKTGSDADGRGLRPARRRHAGLPAQASGAWTSVVVIHEFDLGRVHRLGPRDSVLQILSCPPMRADP